jgi:hypothetical protein
LLEHIKKFYILILAPIAAHSSLKQSEPVFLNVYGAHAIDSKECIPPANVAWRAGTITLFLLILAPIDFLKIPALFIFSDSRVKLQVLHGC